MPRVRYTADGGHYRTNGVGFDPGDVRDVGPDLAEYLCDRDDFERVDEPSSDAAADGAGSEAAADASESEGEKSPDEPEGEASEAAAESDETEASDDEASSDAFDADTFLDRNVGPVTDDISAGEADEHLDALAEQADRVTVTDAIGERRAELDTQAQE
ncbi:hypothetical protein [Halobellus rubicundus]|uniref:Uncharacterized protein n=1 Tax=Halobellus rubicundus TaxID=2996466 RepID=A0ABD5MIQ5_9EURY